MGKIVGICTSEKRGTVKKEQKEVNLIERLGAGRRCPRWQLAQAGQPSFL